MMEQRNKRNYGTVSAIPLCLAILLCSVPAHGEKSNKRCFTAEETFYKVHNLKSTPHIESVKHCYSDKDHPYRYSVVDVPVSLTDGTVRTPEFTPATDWYWIMIQVEKPLPFERLECMMAVANDSPQSQRDCPFAGRLLQADWNVFEGGKVISSGSTTTHADAKFTADNIFKFLGSFPAISGHKYVVEVKFTKDGTPLNVANPHLIVIKQGEE